MTQHKDIVALVRRELSAQGDGTVAKSQQQFFKERIKAYGVKTPAVKRLAQELGRDIAKVQKEAVFEWCEALWQSGFLEESIVACQWSFAQRKAFTTGDFVVFERWVLQYVNNWASCDTFCNHTVGELLLRYPDCIPSLQTWATAENRWLRRAAAVSLIVPARQGKYFDTVLKIAALQLSDNDDLVQKGYGWLLKVAANHHQDEVFAFIMQHKDRMPRTALRYAIEKMPPEKRLQAMGR